MLALLPFLGRNQVVQLLVSLLDALLLEITLDGCHFVVKPCEHTLAIGLIKPFRKLYVRLIVKQLVYLELREFTAKAQWSLDGNIIESEIVIVKYLRLHLVILCSFLLLESHVGFEYLLAM